MIMQKLLFCGLVFWYGLITACAGNDLVVIAWGCTQAGKPQFITYSLPVSDGHTNWGLVKVCPAGSSGGLVLGPDQVVRAVGDMPAFLKPPDGLGKVVDIAAGRELGVALSEDKTLKIWGVDSRVNALAPGILTNVAAITASMDSYMTIDTTGKVNFFATGLPDAIQEVSNVAAVSLSRALFSPRRVALTRDGTVLEWRKHSAGIVSRAELSNVVAVAASPVHSLALKRDGTVAAWGSNAYGELEVPEGLSNVVAIAAGGSHPGAGTGVGFGLALKADGTVVGWGKLCRHDSVVPPGLSNVVAITAGETFCLAVTTNSAVADKFRR